MPYDIFDRVEREAIALVSAREPGKESRLRDLFREILPASVPAAGIGWRGDSGGQGGVETVQAVEQAYLGAVVHEVGRDGQEPERLGPEVEGGEIVDPGIDEERAHRLRDDAEYLAGECVGFFDERYADVITAIFIFFDTDDLADYLILHDKGVLLDLLADLGGAMIEVEGEDAGDGGEERAGKEDP